MRSTRTPYEVSDADVAKKMLDTTTDTTRTPFSIEHFVPAIVVHQNLL